MSQPFRWDAPVGGADFYELKIGSVPGANDLLDSGAIPTTSFSASGLASSGPLYAEIWAKVNGQWTMHSDIGFTLDATVQPSTIVQPPDATPDFDTAQPFVWSDVAMARGYRLTIGTTPGGADLHDSGAIHVSQRFVRGLPTGAVLYGRVQSLIGGQWLASDFTFVVAANTASAALEIKSALWATDFVRNMALEDNRPFEWTELFTAIAPQYSAVCTDYSSTLLRVLAEMNLDLPARRLDVAFDTNTFDVHTLVELQNPETGVWMLLDPTFDLTVTRADGSPATAEDMSQATLTSDWSAVTYVFLGAAGDAYARQYYVDYPLLFLNVFHQGQPIVIGQGSSPLPYLQLGSVPTTGPANRFAIQCLGANSAAVIIDGSTVTVPCNGIDSLSQIFTASSVDAPADASGLFQLYLVPRFVF